MTRKYKHVAVLMGGISAERDISLKSGHAVAAGLREAGYQVDEVDVCKRDFALSPEVEAVFIALHGEFGEDGEVQRILNGKGVPFTGSNAEPSRIAFDKILTRECLQENGIPVPDGEVLRVASERTLGIPVAVKPPCQGSSVGCHLVFDESAWDVAFADAAQYGEDVLVEQYIPGRELTVGVVGEDILPVVEICAQDGWYDYDAKYVTGNTSYEVPAVLEPEIAAEAQALARKTFDALGAEGFGRVDFRLSPENKLFVLELNTIPGFTAASLLPKAAKAQGIGFSELCSRIIEDARI